mgnify:FL=1
MLLDIKSLRVFYGRVEAVHGVDFHVDTGEVVTIIGNNGAGKSSILRAISGVVKGVTGTIRFNGQIINEMNPASIVKLGISQTPEGRQVFSDSTVYENLVGGAYIRKDKQKIKEDIERCYELFPILKSRRNQKAGLMSGGEQQMLAIARSLMSNPKLLMLDEPSLGLAPVVVEDVYEKIAEIKKTGTSILLVEQNANTALSVADRGYVLVTGTMGTEGTSKELLSNDEIRSLYMGV